MDRGDLTPCRDVGEVAGGSDRTAAPANRPSTILPSRARARESCRSAIASGLVLLSGEAGTGKTWLWRSLADERAGQAEWVAVDIGPTTDPAGLIHSIARALGVPSFAEADPARAAIADALWDASQDGRRHILVLDEAQNAGDDVLEEIRVVANGLGRPDGWAGILLCGQTPLVRRLRARPLAPLEARIRRRIHLGPIDLAEAVALLRPADPDAIEERHRDARGNPARLLRGSPPPPRAALAQREEPRRPFHPLPPAAPERSPLVQVEEGVVEVGWDPEVESPAAAQLAIPTLELAPPAPEGAREEVIDDPYATLQAWQEWSQGRHGDAAEPDPVRWTVGVGPSQVRAESQQPFSPYGDLFGRTYPQPEPE
ncbi:MAG: ATP-binding protein [Isosphaeraceae bacterium]